MYSLHIPKMSCGGCLGTVTRAIAAVDPQARVEGDLERRIVRVETSASEATLLSALKECGYPAAPLHPAVN